MRASPVIDDGDNDDLVRVAGSETDSHEAVALTAEQVRQGHTGDHLRYILAASMVAVLVALFGALIAFSR